MLAYRARPGRLATNVDGKFKHMLLCVEQHLQWGEAADGGRPFVPSRTRAVTIKEGREFFNEKPPESYYKPYVYPHPLQEGWDARMRRMRPVPATRRRRDRTEQAVRTRRGVVKSAGSL